MGRWRYIELERLGFFLSKEVVELKGSELGIFSNFQMVRGL